MKCTQSTRILTLSLTLFNYLETCMTYEKIVFNTTHIHIYLKLFFLTLVTFIYI